MSDAVGEPIIVESNLSMASRGPRRGMACRVAGKKQGFHEFANSTINDIAKSVVVEKDR